MAKIVCPSCGKKIQAQFHIPAVCPGCRAPLPKDENINLKSTPVGSPLVPSDPDDPNFDPDIYKI